MVLKLEVFEPERSEKAASTVVLDTLALEETKLASYETGYSAGWEDAVAAQSGDQAKIRADLAQNLQSLSFTYNEARDHVLRAIEPLLTEVVNKLLPKLSQDVLTPTILQLLLPMAEDLAEAPISLVINPSVRAAVDTLLEQVAGLPIEVVEEPSLSEGQAYLRLGEMERQINLDRATQDISTAVRGFFERPEKERTNG
jgi:flagellar biosynthesis/type III secretory pathway protein FliH